MTKSLWSQLILSLTILFVVSLIINRLWDAGGFFINLSTEVAGIIITVVYVDSILKRNEKQRWLPTDNKVADRLRVLLISTVTTVRSGLKLGAEILDDGAINSNDPVAIHQEIVRLTEFMSPMIYRHICDLNTDNWRSLDTAITILNGHILTFLMVFQIRLSPQQISDLLELQEALSNSRIFYTTFPDLAGIPEGNLPPTLTPPEILQKSGYEATSKELSKALTMVRALSQSITDNA